MNQRRTFPLFKTLQAPGEKLSCLFDFPSSQVMFSVQGPNLGTLAKLFARSVILFFSFLSGRRTERAETKLGP
jgi:hypothetical protein